MKKITEEMYITRFPLLNYNYFNELGDKEEYLKEYVFYNNMFLKYLIKNTSLKQIDNEIGDSRKFKHQILGVSEGYQDLYQYLCNEELTFFYIRNNIYIEALSKEEKDFLDSKIGSEYNDEIESFIKNTFKKVIFEDVNKDKSIIDINYGPSTSRNFFSSNDSLVIGARMVPGFSKVDNKENRDEYFARLAFFRKKCEELKDLLNDELNMEVSVIEYSDSSIRELDIESENVLK